jgi:hypothetical protein
MLSLFCLSEFSERNVFSLSLFSIPDVILASSDDKSIETIDSEEDKCKAAAMNSDIPNRPESLILKKTIHYEKRRSV